ncbi:hypothetical protein [uncultured Jatrophihabitans sp.]|uniref:hypothetical protein n=1 Tax=uncultured Jatrophihabitans sp. TaxID=1610747 RepID=UPI0035CA6616
MAPNAVERLNQLLTNDMTLLELGSGSSTAWFAARVGRVVSIEPNADWARRTSESLRGLGNVTIISESIAAALPSAEPSNVVIVDHNDEAAMTRVDALAIVVDFADIIVLDDSDRKEYAQSDEITADWNCERYVGFRPRPLIPTETTIFIRA